MPSKYGFGNSRKVSPHKLATYGADNKNPIISKSPMKHPHNGKVKEKKGITINAPWDFGGSKRLIKKVWKKYGPVINPSTKNP